MHRITHRKGHAENDRQCHEGRIGFCSKIRHCAKDRCNGAEGCNGRHNDAKNVAQAQGQKQKHHADATENPDAVFGDFVAVFVGIVKRHATTVKFETLILEFVTFDDFHQLVSDGNRDFIWRAVEFFVEFLPFERV